MASVNLARRTSASHSPQRVFVSSTFIDLASHRTVVIDTLLRLGLFPDDMEHMGAQGEGDATSVSLEYLSTADLYIIIVAWRYGHIPPGEHLSVTHLEYEEAKRLRLPCFVFLADPSTETENGERTLFPAATRSTDQLNQLLDFRTQLSRENLREYFTTPEDLGRKVATALSPVAYWRPPHALPPRVPGFVGRQSEIRQLTLNLREGQSTGLSAEVAGLAGVGKSALASEVLHLVAAKPDTFPGGITWIQCDKRLGEQGLVWVYDRLLREWGVARSQVAPGSDTDWNKEVAECESSLRAWFRPIHPGDPGRPAIALLDNVERDLPVGRLLETLGGLGITVLLTARHQVISPYIRLMRLDVLDAASASALFVGRYVNEGGALHPWPDEQVVMDIVNLLGRLPLAIELAAARSALRRISPKELAAELQQADRLRKLSDPLDPEGSVRYAFAQTFNTLASVDQVCFVAMGGLDGSDWPRIFIDQMFDALLTLWSVDNGSAGSHIDASPILDRLIALSLVQPASADVHDHAETQAHGDLPIQVRVQMHTLLRDYAADELRNQSDSIRTAISEAVMSAIELLVKRLHDDPASLAREDRLIVGALEHATEKEIQHRTIIAVVDALDSTYLKTHPAHTRTLYNLRLRSARALGDYEEEWKALHDLGHFATRHRAWEEARQYYEDALPVLQNLPDKTEQRVALSHLGEIALERTQFEEASRFFESALVLSEEADDLGNVVGDLSRLERLAFYQHDTQRVMQLHNRILDICQKLCVDGKNGASLLLRMAKLKRNSQGAPLVMQYLEEVLVLSRAHGDRQSELDALHELGHKAEDHTDYSNALKYFEENLAVFRQRSTSANGQGPILRDLARVASKAGNQTAASTYYQEAVSALGYGHLFDTTAHDELVYRSTRDHAIEDMPGQSAADDNRSEEMNSLHQMGHVADSAGRSEDALLLFRQAYGIAQQVDDHAMACRLLIDMGDAAYALGNVADANTYYDHAVSLEAELHVADLGIGGYENLAHLAAKLGHDGEAETYHTKALGEVKYSATLQIEAEILQELSELATKRDDHESAAQYLQRSISVLEQAGDDKSTQALLDMLVTVVQYSLPYDFAIQYLDFVIERQHRLGQITPSMDMLFTMAYRYYTEGNTAAGSAMLERAIAETTLEKDPVKRATSLAGLSALAFNRGEDSITMDRIVNWCTDAVMLLEDTTELVELVSAQITLGVLLRSQDRYEEALKVLTQVISNSQQIGVSEDKASALHQRGHSLQGLHRFAEAAHDFEQSLAFWRDVGDRELQAALLRDLADIAREQGDLAQATMNYEEAAEILVDLGEQDTVDDIRAEIASLSAFTIDSSTVSIPVATKNNHSWREARHNAPAQADSHMAAPQFPVSSTMQKTVMEPSESREPDSWQTPMPKPAPPIDALPHSMSLHAKLVHTPWWRRFIKRQ